MSSKAPTSGSLEGARKPNPEIESQQSLLLGIDHEILEFDVTFLHLSTGCYRLLGYPAAILG